LAISTIPPANALRENLCAHRDTHERHRELAMPPLAAWLLAQKEGRCALRPAPKCPWWPYVFSQRSTVKVQPDGPVAASTARLRIQASPGTRLVHCLHPNGDISILRQPPDHTTKPQVLLHLPFA